MSRCSPTVPLWVSKRGACCLPHRGGGEGYPAPGLDSEHGWLSHRTASRRSPRWVILPGQRTSEAGGACRRFRRRSYGREGDSSKLWISSGGGGADYFRQNRVLQRNLFHTRKGPLNLYVYRSLSERSGSLLRVTGGRLNGRIQTATVIKHHQKKKKKKAC